MRRDRETRQVPLNPQNISQHIDRSKVDPQIVKAAEGMETMFLDYMMKVMRQTVPKSDMDLESPATEIYRSMLDSEYAEKAAHAGAAGGGIGLADQVIAYLQSRGYNVNHRPTEHHQEPVQRESPHQELGPTDKEKP